MLLQAKHTLHLSGLPSGCSVICTTLNQSFSDVAAYLPHNLSQFTDCKTTILQNLGDDPLDDQYNREISCSCELWAGMTSLSFLARRAKDNLATTTFTQPPNSQDLQVLKG